MADNIENKFWMVLLYEVVKALIELMLSPAAIKEERDRRPRLLLDKRIETFWIVSLVSCIAYYSYPI